MFGVRHGCGYVRKMLIIYYSFYTRRVSTFMCASHLHMSLSQSSVFSCGFCKMIACLVSLCSMCRLITFCDWHSKCDIYCSYLAGYLQEWKRKESSKWPLQIAMNRTKISLRTRATSCFGGSLNPEDQEAKWYRWQLCLWPLMHALLTKHLEAFSVRWPLSAVRTPSHLRALA